VTQPPEPALTTGAIADALQALTAIVDAQHANFVGHAARVADLAAAIGVTLGLSDDTIQDLRTAGHLHDLGMLLVPSEVLRKVTPLTTEEMLLIRYHPVAGATMAASLVNPTIQACIRGHHERWDGSGYPDRLAKSEIPLGARIVAASEIFDALTSERPYRPRIEEAGALERLAELAGVVVDPEVAAATAATVRDRRGLLFVAGDHPFDVEAEETEQPGARTPSGPPPSEQSETWTGPRWESL
jgi:HD-GYP domain-containing protein (c-di-GMP phosphodiesterase class II)